MLGDAKRLHVSNCAERVLAAEGLSTLPICPMGIAKSQDIEVIPKEESDQGVSGMLLRSGNSFAIMYATHIRNEGFRRFSVAHELGHYFLEGHPEALFAASDTHVSRAGFLTHDGVEAEADYFAANLLMPRSLILHAAKRFQDGLEAVEGLAEICKTSTIASAIRYAETTRAPIAIVVSKGRLVEYCFMSGSLKEYRGLTWLRKGSTLPRDSATLALNLKASAVENSQRDEQESDFSVWFDGRTNHALFEEVVGLGTFGKTLTVLSADAYADDSDDEDEGDDRPHF